MDIHDRLLARLKELDTRRRTVEVDGDHAAPGQDGAAQDDLATDCEIAGIQAALDRLRTGEYGFCKACGGEISEARLDRFPATPFCRTCLH